MSARGGPRERSPPEIIGRVCLRPRAKQHADAPRVPRRRGEVEREDAMLLLRTDAKTRLTAREERAERVGVALRRRLPHARVDPAERVGECVAQTRDGGGTLSILGRGAVRPAARGAR